MKTKPEKTVGVYARPERSKATRLVVIVLALLLLIALATFVFAAGAGAMEAQARHWPVAHMSGLMRALPC